MTCTVSLVILALKWETSAHDDGFSGCGTYFPDLKAGIQVCFGCGIPKMTYGIARKFGTGRREWTITQWGTPSLGLYPEPWRHREKLARSFPDFDRENAKGLGWGTPWREQNILVEKICTTHIKENKNRQKKPSSMGIVITALANVSFRWHKKN